MCLPACTIQLAEQARASRRSFISKLAACATVASPVLAARTFAAPSTTQSAGPARGFSFSRIVDLTHTLSASFPFPMDRAFSLERISTRGNGKDVWNINRWHFHEHIGTHIDAPFHCSDGDTAERIPADKLIGPLVVVDIRDRAAADFDTQLTPDDLKAWERRNGPIPAAAIVAMNSGWDARVGDARRFFGHDEKNRFHMPGFHVEAVQFLHQERDVIGIASDTISLDPGQNKNFPVHHYWLGQNKWGLENVANLGKLPPKGATIVVGAPKILGATGGPSRVLALVA